jgi:hypothetical protein
MQSLIVSLLSPYNITVNALQPSFCFVPTPSALDIGRGAVALNETDYLTAYVGAFPPTGLKSTPFAYYTTAFTYGNPIANNNDYHIETDPRNGDWGANQLEVADNVSGIVYTPANCSGACGASAAGYANVIQGPTTFCVSDNYSIPSTLSNGTVGVDWFSTWSVGITPGESGSSYSLSEVVSNPAPATGLQTTLTGAGEAGYITLYDSVNVCGVPQKYSINIIPGSPPNPVITYASYPQVNNAGYPDGYSIYYFTASPIEGVTSYNWYVDGNLEQSGSSTSFNYTFVTDGTAIVWCIAVNMCGSSSDNGNAVLARPGITNNTNADTLNAQQSYIISPNPASNAITIAVNGSNITTATQIASNKISISNSTVAGFDDITIYDLLGNALQHQVYNQVPQATIDVSNLQNGTYFVVIVSGASQQVQKIIIQK